LLTTATAYRIEWTRLVPRTIDSLLPTWCADARRSDDGGARPFDRPQLLLRLRSEAGDGCFGPCSDTTRAVLTDAIAPYLSEGQLDSLSGIRSVRAVLRHQGGPHVSVALAALELAAIDRLARMRAVNAVELLGGRVRRSVPAYLSVLSLDLTHPLTPQVAEWASEEGYRGTKWRSVGHRTGQPPTAEVDALMAIQAHTPDDVLLAVDAVAEWSVDYARAFCRQAAAAGLRLSWLEEPVPPMWAARLRDIPFPRAGGESQFGIAEQLAALVKGDHAIWQPDVAWHGLQSSLDLVRITGSLNVATYPHSTALVPTVTLASLVDSTAVPCVEVHAGLEPARQYTAAPLIPQRGELVLSDRIGFGIEYDTEEGADV
jgi:L-alanine-DL-glutamate epimerase-like enolase superfamily enzyme